MTPPALLFDLDGTLVDSARGIATALSHVRQERGGAAIDVSEVRPLVSRGAALLVQYGLGTLATEPARDLAAFRAVLMSLTPDPADIFPGVVDALERLTFAGNLLAIVTNKPEQLSLSLLDGLGLLPWFKALVGGDTLPSCKPDPMPLREALRRLGAGSSDAIMIGDSAIDQEAARASPMPFVLFRGGYESEVCLPQFIAESFDHFAMLPDLVARMRRADAAKVDARLVSDDTSASRR